MNIYKYIEPEVAGELGNESLVDNSRYPPEVKNLHYVFHGWSGDDILESFPCFIITERLMNEIKKQKLSGIIFKTLKVSKALEFIDMYPNMELPIFYWAIINGKIGEDDFVIANDFRLLISEKAHEVINLFNSGNAIFEDF